MPISNLHEFFVQLHLTERCNLSCTHCYQYGGRTAELNLPEIRDLLTEVSEMLQAWSAAYGIDFSSSFNVTGGEPFLRHDLFDILAEICAGTHDVYLLTNGILIDPEKAAALASLDIQGVQVSIEGPEETHDSIRGRGSFAGALRGISHLVDAGLIVTLNATLSEINCDRFAEMIALCTSLGVQRLGFSRLVPSGRGFDLVDRMISPDKMKELYTEIFSLNTAPLEIVTGDPVASQLRSGGVMDDCGEIATGGCAAGVSGLTILPDGTVVPCRRLTLPIGNVRTDSLREIWADSKILEQLRDRKRYRGKCGKCARWAICRGCRAIAWADSIARGAEDLCGDDPQCCVVEGV